MKKSIISIVLVAGLFASCSQYTCATYAKSSPEKKAVTEKRL